MKGGIVKVSNHEGDDFFTCAIFRLMEESWFAVMGETKTLRKSANVATT
jgi:hypothetical protein